MFRRLGLVLVALVVVPTALAAYPTPYAAQDGTGVMSNDGTLEFDAMKSGNDTIVRATKSNGGAVVMSQLVPGAFGVPLITYRGPAGGMFRDGSTFVLQSVGAKPTTTFRLVSTRDLAVRDTITLPGTFAYDALSPDGSRLYLIQHTSVDDIQHYVVRAYDLGAHTLLPGKIADKSQKGWVMEGFPVARATTADGRWVYTMYWNPSGVPFVHALDTVHGLAHCVGFASPKRGSGAVVDYTMKLKGGKLVVKTNAGAVYRVIDRKTWRVTLR
jgi:hypothetical protein